MARLQDPMRAASNVRKVPMSVAPRAFTMATSSPSHVSWRHVFFLIFLYPLIFFHLLRLIYHLRFTHLVLSRLFLHSSVLDPSHSYSLLSWSPTCSVPLPKTSCLSRFRQNLFDRVLEPIAS